MCRSKEQGGRRCSGHRSTTRRTPATTSTPASSAPSAPVAASGTVPAATPVRPTGPITVVTYRTSNGHEAQTAVSPAEFAALHEAGRLVAIHEPQANAPTRTTFINPDPAVTGPSGADGSVRHDTPSTTARSAGHDDPGPTAHHDRGDGPVVHVADDGFILLQAGRVYPGPDTGDIPTGIWAGTASDGGGTTPPPPSGAASAGHANGDGDGPGPVRVNVANGNARVGMQVEGGLVIDGGLTINMPHRRRR